jgi:hypothetical protein
MPTPRRRFLSWLGSASLLGVASRPSLDPLVRTSPVQEPGHDAHAAPVAETWDMSWTDRVTGRYKAVFDSPEIADGAAMFRADAWCGQYKEVYGAARSDMSPVVVLRHFGFALAMSDTAWSLLELGKEFKLRDQKSRKWRTTNPVSGTAAGGGAPPASSIPGFIAAGGIVLACGWTFGGMASRIAKREKIDMAAARVRARELMVPGIILQPNGIFAALRAQEAGCSYVLAS